MPLFVLKEMGPHHADVGSGSSASVLGAAEIHIAAKKGSSDILWIRIGAAKVAFAHIGATSFDAAGQAAELNKWD